MKLQIAFSHVNIIAENWRKLADFYIHVFDCKPVNPERNLSGDWIDRLTGIKNVHIRGIHLQLPGIEEGHTLEIFEYNVENNGDESRLINSKGFTHIAFRVTNVEETLKKLLKNGGSVYGELVKEKIEELGTIEVVYARDPEGNIIEIQKWN